MTAGAPRLEVFTDGAALAEGAALWLTTALGRTEGPIAVALSGGSTPRPLYERLTQSPWRERMPWDRVHWFWGDERFVPMDDPRSNYRMAYESMLSRAPVPPALIHPVPTDRERPQAAAKEYEAELQRFYGANALDPNRPLFAAVLLGLGEDGHTASLFPHSAALDERSHWVAAIANAIIAPRITLTFPALDSAAEVAFLVEGEGKRDILERLLARDRSLPAARVKPVGPLHIFADRAAVGTFGR